MSENINGIIEYDYNNVNYYPIFQTYPHGDEPDPDDDVPVIYDGGDVKGF
ncbi:hypothetical protein AALA22_08765 [Anaerovoracaceae bacterium 41-7]